MKVIWLCIFFFKKIEDSTPMFHTNMLQIKSQNTHIRNVPATVLTLKIKILNVNEERGKNALAREHLTQS